MSLAPAVEAVAWDAAVDGGYPVRYDVPPVGRHSRWKVALRLPLVLPHLIALYFCFYLAELITVVAWLIGIFSGRYDPGLAALPTACVRWEARVLTYVGLLRDEYPPFTGGDYPMLFDVPLQTRQSRAGIFFRALLVLPHVVVLYVLSTVWVASVALAWFAVLLTARYPEGLRRLVVGLNRWMLRVVAYALLLRGDYPPFSLGLHDDLQSPQLVSTVPVAAAAWPVAPRQPAFAPAAAPLSPPTAGDLQPEPSAPTEPVVPRPTIFWPTARHPETPYAAAEGAAAAHSEPSEPPTAVFSEQPTEAGDTSTETRPTFFRPRRDLPPS